MNGIINIITKNERTTNEINKMSPNKRNDERTTNEINKMSPNKRNDERKQTKLNEFRL
jgi:hypothetical protein